MSINSDKGSVSYVCVISNKEAVAYRTILFLLVSDQG